MEPSKSAKIGRYTIVKSLGKGLHGAVFLADDPHLHRRVAIKILHPDPGSLKPVISPQAKYLAQLRHPNIVALYDADIAGERVYLVTEFLEGRTLRDEIRERGALPLPEAVSISRQIVDAMGFAHSRGILHMDLNPSNIMRDREGRPRIMDFDLSRNASSPHSGELIGTLRYISPEHTTTRQLDKRTDVYALGLIMYELIVGQPVVGGNDQKKMVEQIRSGTVDWTPLRQCDPSGAVTAVIEMALRHDPTQRFVDASAMHKALMLASRHISYRGGDQDPPLHGTIEFMLRRIERKGDFPAISRTLMDINRMTAEDSSANSDQLANVILRDYSMTSRLLKLANSALYGNFAGRVKSVTDAVRLLGAEQVRMACNGLACFGHFSGKRDDRELLEMLVRSFVAGLITRFLALRCGMRDAEEAFICGMLHDLGRTVTMYYFRDDYEDVQALTDQGTDENAAARTVLGVRYPELGYAIAREWSFPDIILYCMADNDMRIVPPAIEHAETLRCLTVFANVLTRIATLNDSAEGAMTELDTQLRSIAEFIALEPAHAAATMAAALEKFTQFAPVLEVNTKDSEFLHKANAWVEAMRSAGSYSVDVPAGRIVVPVARTMTITPTELPLVVTAGIEDGEWTREFHRLLNSAVG
ncbi:MAG: HDOD domain-containing protein [Gammaproteobacteria bacterium]